MIIQLGSLSLQVDSLTYMVELLIAEFIFLYSFEKRKNFLLRFISSSIVAALLALLVHITQDGNIYVKFLRFLLLIAMSIAVMLFSFKGNVLIIMSACTAGVATQHFAVKFRLASDLIFHISSLFSDYLIYQIVSEFIFFGLTYAGAYFIFAKPSVRIDYKKNGDPRLSILSAIIVLMCIGINRFVVDIGEEVNTKVQLAASLYAMVCSAFALVIQFNLNRWNRDKTELQITKRLLKDEKKQYDQWKSSVDLVNIRFHDIKHMLSDIKSVVETKGIDCPNLSVIEKAVNAYTNSLTTGNDVLDVMLINMSEFCHNHNIQFSYMGNAQSLKQADGMELYSLFGNAIDNAIESVSKIEDENKRIIDLTIKEFGESLIIHIWNYFIGDVQFRDGLPVPSGEEDIHGYGMKSMKMIVDRAGGTMNAYTKGEVFNLDIILPSHSKDKN